MQTDPWAGLGAPRTPLSSLKQDESFPRWLTFPELLEGEGKGSGWGVCCGEGRGGEGTGRKGYLTWSPQCPICLTKGDLGSSRPPPPASVPTGNRYAVGTEFSAQLPSRLWSRLCQSWSLR